MQQSQPRSSLTLAPSRFPWASSRLSHDPSSLMESAKPALSGACAAAWNGQLGFFSLPSPPPLCCYAGSSHKKEKEGMGTCPERRWLRFICDRCWAKKKSGQRKLVPCYRQPLCQFKQILWCFHGDPCFEYPLHSLFKGLFLFAFQLQTCKYFQPFEKKRARVRANTNTRPNLAHNLPEWRPSLVM